MLIHPSFSASIYDDEFVLIVKAVEVRKLQRKAN
jgi:hypothetical protein